MRHAQPEDLAPASGMLAALRGRPQLVERRPGVFYIRGRAFLHFHVDPAGLYVDVRLADEWERFRVATDDEQRGLLEAVDSAVPAPPA